METAMPALVLPPWLEYTVTGTLVLLALWLILQLISIVVSKFKAGKAVDDRVIQQLAERDRYVKKVEAQSEKYFERNMELTDKFLSLSTDYLAKATDFKSGMERAFGEIKTVREEVQDCKEQHKECTTELAAQRQEFKTQLAALTAQVAVVAVNAAPAERHTNTG